MPTDIFREINTPVVTVIWQETGLSTTEMEQRVTTYGQYSISSDVSNIRDDGNRHLLSRGVGHSAHLRRRPACGTARLQPSDARSFYWITARRLSRRSAMRGMRSPRRDGPRSSRRRRKLRWRRHGRPTGRQGPIPHRQHRPAYGPHSENALFTSDDLLAQDRIADMQALVGLFNALGGGWQDDEPSVASAAARLPTRDDTQ
jgi:hypothetical protein